MVGVGGNTIPQVQAEIAATPGLGQGGVLILDESADKKAMPSRSAWIFSA